MTIFNISLRLINGYVTLQDTVLTLKNNYVTFKNKFDD